MLTAENKTKNLREPELERRFRAGWEGERKKPKGHKIVYKGIQILKKEKLKFINKS